MIVECKNCRKINEQKEISNNIYKCGFCGTVYEITDTLIKLENSDVPVRVANGQNEIMEMLPPDLMEKFCNLEPKFQKIILYTSVLNMTQKKIAEEMGINEQRFGRLLNNRTVKEILSYLTLQIIQQNTIRENLKASELRDKMYNWMGEVFEGEDNALKEKVSKILVGLSDNKTNSGLNKKATKDLKTTLV